MSRAKKIAPTLVYAHKPVPPREIAQGRGIGVRSYHAESAWRELRALLVCAQVLRRIRRDQATQGATGNEGAIGDAMRRALARLDRVSGLPGRGRAK